MLGFCWWLAAWRQGLVVPKETVGSWEHRSSMNFQVTLEPFEVCSIVEVLISRRDGGVGAWSWRIRLDLSSHSYKRFCFALVTSSFLLRDPTVD